MLTALGVEHALAGTFFAGDLHLALHGSDPALPGTEIAGFAYARQPSPSWLLAAPPDPDFAAEADVAFPVATGAWPPVLSVGLWRHAEPAGLLGSLPVENPRLVERGARMVVTQAQIFAAVEAGLDAGVSAPALRLMREGAGAAMARLTHASLHTGTPATAANELRGTPGLAAGVAAHAAGDPVTATPELLATVRSMLAGDALAPGYARTAVSGWTLGGDGAFRADEGLAWPAPLSLPVLEWQTGGEGVVFPGEGGSAWPEVAAVGLCEGADGPVVAWTSHFVLAGETLPAASPGSGLRITELRLTLFDRSRIAAAE